MKWFLYACMLGWLLQGIFRSMWKICVQFEGLVLVQEHRLSEVLFVLFQCTRGLFPTLFYNKLPALWKIIKLMKIQLVALSTRACMCMSVSVYTHVENINFNLSYSKRLTFFSCACILILTILNFRLSRNEALLCVKIVYSVRKN